MKISTRNQIIKSLEKQHTASARELSQILGFSCANIHHHLTVLEEIALVEIIGKRHVGRGRPENIYGVSQRILGDGLGVLSDILLEEIFNEMSGSVNEDHLRSIARRLEATISDRSEETLPRRLTNFVLHLNQFLYQARWEASAKGARLVFNHCPFSRIINRHPELCLIDAYMLEAHIIQPVIQSAKLERLDSGLTQCVFLVR